MRTAIALTCLLAAWLPAQEWHVAPTGSDTTGDGSLASPFASIGKALGSSVDGDTIRLQANGRWRETFTLGGGRTLNAYGAGARPEVTASQQASFTGTSGSAKTVAVASPVLAVWIDGAFCRLARYPNKGASPEWLRVENGSGNNLIVDTGLKAHAADRFTGAQVRWRRWSWWYETRQITDDDGASTLTLAADAPSGTTWTNLGAESLGNSPDGQGSCYYIDNDLDELDAPGEWFWGGGTLLVILPSGSTATAVEFVTSTTGVTIAGATVEGVAFRRFGGAALTVTGASTLRDCLVEEVEDTGIALANGSAGSTVQRCILRDIRNTGLTVWQNTGGAAANLIERNLLHRIGMEPGYGGSGTWRQAGIILGNVVASTTRLNRIVDTGYAGIIVGSAGQTVSNNILVRCMGTLNDGAAIYTNCISSTITGNIVLDTIGDLSSSHPWWPLGHGIWPEFLKDFKNQVIEDNTVFGCNGNGIVLDNNYTSSIQRNTVVGCRSNALVMDVEQTTSGTNVDGVSEAADNDLRAQNHTLAGNVLATVVPSPRIVRPENINKWYLAPYSPPDPALVSSYGGVDYGTMSNTTAVTPTSGSGVFTGSNPDSTWTSLAGWSAGNPSWAQNSGLQATGNAYLLINDTESAASMPLPAGTWTLADGTAVAGPVAVAPFRSVLLRTAGTLPTAPYAVASGLDWRQAVPTAKVLGDDAATREIEVLGNGLSITDGDTTPSLADHTDFGAIATDGGTVQRTFTIRNLGSLALTISGATLSGTQAGDFTITTPPTASVAAWGQTTVVVTCDPSADGVRQAVLTIASNDADEASFDVAISGTGQTGGAGGGAGDGGGGGGGCGAGSAIAGLLALLLAAGLRRRRQ